jgi:hypothetical protein
MNVRETRWQSAPRSLPSKQKLYTLRGVSAVYVGRNVNAGFPVRIRRYSYSCG